MMPNTAARLVTADEEDEKEEVVFANPVISRCRTNSSTLDSEHNHRLKVDTAQTELSMKKLVPLREFEIMPWAAYQSKLMEHQHHSCSKFESNEKSPSMEENETQTLSQYQPSPRHSFTLSNPAEVVNMEMQTAEVWNQAPENSREANISPINVSNVPPQATVLKVDQGADNDLLEFERFLSQNSFTRQISTGNDTGMDTAVGNVIDNMVGTHMTDPNALEQDFRSLRKLSVNEGTRNLIGTSGGIRAAIDALAAFPSHERLHEQGVTFLADICQRSEDNKLQVGHSGGIRVIVSSMRQATQQSISLLEKCCETLWTCCHECELNQRIAGEVGGVEVLITAMRKGKQAAGLQGECLRTLHALAGNNIAMVTILRDSGGVQEVLATLRQFSTEEAIQIAGMQLLFDILRQSDDMRSSLGNSGLMDDIEDHFPRYSTSSGYVTLSSACIRYLAFDADNRTYMASCGTIQLLFSALQAWATEEQVVLSILLALGNITFDSDRAKHSAARDGGATMLITVLSQYSTHASISEQACRLLRNISDGRAKAKRKCVRSGVVSALAKTMRSLPGVAGVQEHAAAALLNLSSIQEGALRSAKLEGHVKRALVLHHGTTGAAGQLLHLQDVLEHLRNRSMLLSGLFGGSRGSSPKTSSIRPAAEDVLHEPALVSAVAALSHHEHITEY